MRSESELKFLLGRRRTDELFGHLTQKLTPERFAGPDVQTFVRTIYLDSDSRLFLRSSDTDVRRRLRIREYAAGAPNESVALTGVCFLELKESRGVVRRKSRLAIPPRVLGQLVSGEEDNDEWDAAMRNIAAFRPLVSAIRNGALAPRMTSWCNRQSLYGDGIRVTLDRNLTFGPPTLPGCPHDPEAVTARGPEQILEVKVTGTLPAWLQDALEGDRPAQFSKFHAGMSALDKPAPHAPAPQRESAA